MSTTYSPAPQVRDIADDLIADHHPDLAELEIRYIFREPAAKSKGKVVYGKARKVTGLNAYLGQGYKDHEPVADRDDTFLVVEIAADEWLTLTPAQRIALVDHELCHFTVEYDDDGNRAVNVVGHDLEEFRDVVARHGLWRPEVRAFTDTAVKQLSLDVISAAEQARETVQEIVDRPGSGIDSISVQAGDEEPVTIASRRD